MFKNIYFRLGLISTLTTLAVLIALPRIPVTFHSKFINIDSFIGGYYLALFNGKTVIDLRELKTGLDLKGGIRVILKADMSQIDSAERVNALESAKEIISRRVNLLGVTEPYVTTSRANDEYRIIVEIPGLENTQEAVALIGQTAQLRYKTLKPEVPWSEDKYLEYYQDPSVWEDTGITGADMKGADVVINQGGDINSVNRPEIQLRFTNEGRQKFSEAAKANINKPIALFLDEGSYPLSMPIVSPDLANGLTTDPVINGTFTMEDAKNLSIQIRAGALPVPVSVLQQSTIGATLGNDSVHKSFYAGIVGLLLVLLFLVFRYGRLGLLAGISLFIYTVVVIAAYKLIPVVLTLPGIAGFVLSIGMATDANVLIFERVKEELFWGKPTNLAIKLGFDRAWNSIKDSNASSLITSFILFEFGSGPVRGFALTLALGIVISLFTSIFVVRTFIEAFNIGNISKTKEVKA
jgi:preprotein translocase subunit SecD